MADGHEPIVFAHPLSAAHRPRVKRRIVWFAGGGGSSAAMLQAFGAPPDAALNHWHVAIGAHMAHFPQTEHYCSDAFEVKPEDVFPSDDIDFGWFSPDCTDFSRAKGKALRSERRRGLAWVVVDWAKARRVRCIIVENVAEFQGWGPLYPEGHEQAGERIPEREGETFREWVQALRDLGYAVEWKVLNAADYGAPTTRERLYVKARCDGKPIIWPAPTHAPRKKCVKLGLKPWRGACEVIDFSIDCPSIFLTPPEIKAAKLKVKRPLVAATLKRVARGIDRFVISSADPFIVGVTQRTWGGDRADSVDEPLRTITTSKGGEFAVVEPFVAHLTHQGAPRVSDIGEPLATVTGANRGEMAMISPCIIRTDMQSSAARNGIRDVCEPLATTTSGGGIASVEAELAFISSNYTSNTCGGRGDPREPAKTFASANHHSVISAAIVGCGGRRGQSPPCDVENPFPTVTGKADACLTTAHLVGRAHGASLQRQFGRSIGSDIEEPAGTVTGGGSGKTALMAAHLGRQFGSTVSGRDIAEPHPTVMTEGGGGKSQLVAAHLESYYDTGIGSDCAEPMRAATAKPRHALTAAWVEQANTDMVGRALREPLSTMVGRGTTQRLIELRLEIEGGEVGRRGQVLAFLWDQFGSPTDAEWTDPLATREGRLKLGLVVLQGQVWMIVDIGLRMLVPKELAGAMGLLPEIDLSVDNYGRPITKTNQTHLIGNMVSPPPARALMEADCLDDAPLTRAAA